MDFILDHGLLTIVFSSIRRNYDIMYFPIVIPRCTFQCNFTIFGVLPSLKNKDVLYKFQMSTKMTSIWQVRFIIIKQVYNTLLNQFLLCCTFRRFTKTQLPDCQLYRLIFYHDFTVGPKFLIRMQSIDCCL